MCNSYKKYKYKNKIIYILYEMTTHHNIPKRIFQTFQNENFSPRFQEIVDSWKIHNPDYDYVFFDDSACDKFMRTQYDVSVYNAYCRIIPQALKADLWRYCILYAYGGVYADIDTLCLSSIDTLLEDNIELMTVVDLNPAYKIDGLYNLFNAFIAVAPRSPIMLQCIERVLHNVENNIMPPSRLDFSGPGVLGRSVNYFLNRPETESFVGKEGVIDNIKLLYFDPNSEHISDISGNVLFQNKNGNHEIIDLYMNEKHNTNNICWITTSQYLKHV